MFCFGILGLFWREIAKVQKLENLGIIGLLCRSVDLRQGMQYPRHGEDEVTKWNPSGTSRRSKSMSRRRLTPQHSSATPRRSDECKTHLCFEFISHAILRILYPYSCKTHKISSKLGFVGLLMKRK